MSEPKQDELIKVLLAENDQITKERDELKAELEILRSKESQFESTVLATVKERDELQAKLDLVREDEGIQNRLLELFETRRESDDRLKIALETLKEAREQLALMSDGEGDDSEVYRTISNAAMKDCDKAIAKIEGNAQSKD